MSQNLDISEIIELAEIRTERVLNATQVALVPGEDAPLSAQELSRRVAERLAALPPEEGLLLRRKMMVAVNDLEELVETLQSQMTTLAQELRRVSNHSSAVTAYNRPLRHPSAHRS